MTLLCFLQSEKTREEKIFFRHFLTKAFLIFANRENKGAVFAILWSVNFNKKEQLRGTAQNLTDKLFNNSVFADKRKFFCFALCSIDNTNNHEYERCN